jgi:hypothetical protein
MSVQTLKVGGQRFVVLPESEYRKLKAKWLERMKSVATPPQSQSRKAPTKKR